MLNELSSHSKNLEYIVTYREICSGVLDQLVHYLNSLPIPYANTQLNLQVDTYVQQECHPLFLQTFKPIATTGDGNCMYNALSLAFCGKEHLSVVIRLLTTYALVKYRTAMIDALSHTYFDGNHEQHMQALTLCIIAKLGTDFAATSSFTLLSGLIDISVLSHRSWRNY